MAAEETGLNSQGKNTDYYNIYINDRPVYQIDGPVIKLTGR
jgi:hypothetical protein